ncbi:MAG: LacI family DNA-binding transcriptional regulator, partial [Natronospirillum sp.]
MKNTLPQDSRVTMKDVAKVAGVSQSTVSFVMNGVREVSIAEETKARVLKAAQQLGYRNRRRGSAVVQEHPVLGFMVDEISTSPFAAISIEGAQDAAWQSGYLLEVVMTGNDKEYEAAVLKKWRAYGVEGVIYSSILTRSASPPAELGSMKSVLLNCYSEDTPYPGVVPSEVMGGFSATEALINRGYRNIACIAGEGWAEAAQDRLTGYRNALTTHGIPIKTELIRSGTFLPSSGYTETKAMLDLKLPLDAI